MELSLEEEKKLKKRIQNREAQRRFRQKNPEADIIYRMNHKEEIAKRNRKYSQSEIGKKNKLISIWTSRGLIGNHSKIYDYYLKIDKCQECDCDFGVKGDGTLTFKCMDHCHKTGLFRNVICATCNFARR